MTKRVITIGRQYKTMEQALKPAPKLTQKNRVFTMKIPYGYWIWPEYSYKISDVKAG